MIGHTLWRAFLRNGVEVGPGGRGCVSLRAARFFATGRLFAGGRQEHYKILNVYSLASSHMPSSYLRLGEHNRERHILRRGGQHFSAVALNLVPRNRRIRKRRGWIYQGKPQFLSTKPFLAQSPSLNRRGSKARVSNASTHKEESVEKRQPRANDFALLMKDCKGSNEQRRILKVDMRKAGVVPDVVVFTTLVKKLVFEGDFVEARKVVEEEMPAAGIRPNASTWRNFELPTETLSRMRTQHLSKLLAPGKKTQIEEAWEFFYRLVGLKQADLYQFNLMMKACSSSGMQRNLVDVKMPIAGVKPDDITYRALVRQLMTEGAVDEARYVVEKDMVAAGIQPNAKTRKLLDMPAKELSILRTQHLSNLLAQRDSEALKEAWGFFNRLVNEQEADAYQFRLMMKGCRDSAHQRRLLGEDMSRVGLKPGVAEYTALARQLLLEGNLKSAEKVVEEEMASAGVRPSAETWETLSTPTIELSKLRTRYLSDLVETGRKEDLREAWDFFNKLVRAKQVDIYQFTAMMRACRSSDEQQHLIEVVMREAGVRPNVATYNMLVQKLIFEGNTSFANKVVKRRMRTAGIRPNHYTLKALNIPADNLSKMRSSHLSKLLAHRGTAEEEEAWSFFFGLAEKRQANTKHFNLMMNHCRDSNEQLRLLDVDMRRAGVEPDLDTYTILIKQLMIEGNLLAAQHIVEEEMPADGTEQPARINRVLNMTSRSLSTLRTRYLRNLLAQGDKSAVEKAWELFVRLVETNQADIFQFNLMLKACYNSDEQRHLMDIEMPQAGVKPNVATYNTIINQLVFEGDWLSANRVVDEEMPAAGVKPDEETRKVLDPPVERLSRMRTKHMSNLLAKGGSEEIKEAWELLSRLALAKQAHTFQFSIMLKACYSSDEQRQLIDVEMPLAGAKADITVYTMLAQQFMIEGNALSARKVVEEEMPAAGIKPDRHARKVLELSVKDLSKMRTRRLSDLLTQGASKELNEEWDFFRGYHLFKHLAKGAPLDKAWDFFNILVDMKQANVHHFNLMMQACENSNDQRRLLNVDMKQANVEPTVLTYTILVYQLMIEGNVVAARRVVEEEMPAAGIKPNTNVLKCLDMTSKEVSKMRTQRLSNLFTQGDAEDKKKAWDFFNSLVETKQADLYQFNFMMKVCDSSEEQKHLMSVDMPQAGIKPDIVTYNSLIYQLIFECDTLEARKVITEQIPAAGLKPNWHTRKIMDKPFQDLSKMRTQHLHKILAHKSITEKEKAWDFFDKLVKNKQASVHQFNLMLKNCSNSDKQRRVLDNMPLAGVCPDMLTYSILLKQLMLEGGAISARRLLEEEMPAAGIEPDVHMWNTLDIPEKNLSKMRSLHLAKLLANKSGGISMEAWNFFNIMVENKLVDVYQFNMLMKAFDTSDRQRHLLDVEMPKAGVMPDLVTYNTLIKQLVSEGHASAARRIVDEDMPAAGVQPTASTWKALGI